MAAATTTIVVPAGVQLYAEGEFIPPIASSSAVTVEKTSPFALYFPITAGSTATTVGTAALDTLRLFATATASTSVSPPEFLAVVASSNIGIQNTWDSSLSRSNITVYPGSTAYIAFTAPLPAQVTEVQSILNALQSGPTTTQIGSSASPGVTSSSNSTPSNSASPSTATNTPDSTPFSLDALVGGIVGAFVGALIICALAWCIFGRRKSPQKRSAKELSDEGSMSRNLAEGGQRHSDVSLGEIPGWHKHLPQEKDDSTIKRNFNEVLQHVQMHIEGFYQAKSGRVPDKIIMTLGALAEDDDFVSALKEADNALLVLEGVLVRWIIQRISLRSDPSKSLLPSEYTTIPANNGWHMESKTDVLVAESRKGFAPAFSEWRVLTGFLHPQIKADPAFKRQLDQRIAAGVQEISTQFALWEASGRSESTRAKSLRQILVEASDLGILLFTQPSTYQFEWSGKDVKEGLTKIRTPALVKRLDGITGGMHAPKIIVEATLFNAVRN